MAWLRALLPFALLAVPLVAAAAVNPLATPMQLAEAASVPATDITLAAFVVGPPTGLPSGPSATYDEPAATMPSSGASYAILSTGSAECFATTAFCSSSGSGANYRGAYDVVVLQVHVEVPAGHDHLGMEFVFLSEEWPMFSGMFGDAFIAELDTHSWTTSPFGTVSAPDNFATDQNGRMLSVSTATMDGANAAGTPYGGATCRVTNWVPAAPGSHTLFFSIMDNGDMIYDSVALIDGIRTAHFDATPAPACGTGTMAETPEPILDESDEVKVGQGQQSIAVGYEVTIDEDGSVAAEADCHVKAAGVHVTPSTCQTGV